MKFFGLVLIATLGSTLAHAQGAIDWSAPPVACVEDVVPDVPDRACPDLSKVVDITKDPIESYVTPTDLAYWKARKSRLPYCRSKEILAREAAKPGSFTDAVIKVSLMRMKAAEHHDVKVNAVYSASRASGVPALVLTGALNQESLFAELGISDDGGNYSCGVAQINLYEWCNWAEKLSPNEKAAIGWPAAAHNCQPDDRLWVKPFYTRARAAAGGTAIVDAKYFDKIMLNDVLPEMPAGDYQTQLARYSRVRSFLKNCSNPTNAIHAKANELAELYRYFVPEGMKKANRMTGVSPSLARCEQQGAIGTTPLPLGWLLAVGAYNAGPRVVDAMIEARGFTPAQLEDPRTFENMTPQDLVTSLFWGGVYDPRTDAITVNARAGGTTEMKWMKLCIVQRHVSRVVEHVTLATATEPLVHSLEKEYGPCTASERDPVTNAVVKSGVPALRQTSNGQIPAARIEALWVQ